MAMLASIIGILSGSASADERSRSPHFKEGEFRNGTAVRKSWWDYFKVRISTDYAKWPDWVESPYGEKPVERVLENELRVTLINHSTLLIQTGGLNILTDP
ncbi:MAG: hypothetical protein MUP09_05990, partial [Thiovulaceae bacterium]|nr:hypothetical protein [Sulfurimonadaceae bacterium]